MWAIFLYTLFTENVELHIGERNKLDKYSGGYTAWQDEKTLSNGQFKLKLWYGWFGRGTNNEGDIIPTVIRYIKKLITMPFVSIWKVFKNFTK